MKNASFTSFILLTHLRPVWYRIASTFAALISGVTGGHSPFEKTKKSFMMGLLKHECYKRIVSSQLRFRRQHNLKKKDCNFLLAFNYFCPIVSNITFSVINFISFGSLLPSYFVNPALQLSRLLVHWSLCQQLNFPPTSSLCNLLFLLSQPSIPRS